MLKVCVGGGDRDILYSRVNGRFVMTFAIWVLLRLIKSI